MDRILSFLEPLLSVLIFLQAKERRKGAIYMREQRPFSYNGEVVTQARYYFFERYGVNLHIGL